VELEVEHCRRLWSFYFPFRFFFSDERDAARSGGFACGVMTDYM
jgi:hypothetical protein